MKSNLFRSVNFWVPMIGLFVITAILGSRLGAHLGTTAPVRPRSAATATAEKTADETPQAAAPWQGEYPTLPFEQLSQDKFDRRWQIDLKVDQIPLRDVLQQLLDAEQAWKVEVWPNPILDQTISLDLKQVSTLEAIELACRAVGFHPRYQPSGHAKDHVELFKLLEKVPLERWSVFDLQLLKAKHQDIVTFINLEPGEYPAVKGFENLQSLYPSVTFAGPVRIQLFEIEEDIPNSTGMARVRLTCLPQPENALPSAQETLSLFPWKATEITDAAGTNLDANELIWSESQASTDGLINQAQYLRLKNLRQDVDRIQSLRGQVTFNIPVKLAPTMWFENPQVGDTLKAGPYQATLTEVTAKDLSLKVDRGFFRGADGESMGGPMLLYAFDAEGNSVISGQAIYGIAGNIASMTCETKLTAPAALVAFVPACETMTVQYSQQFVDIPLPNHAKQAASSVELRYGEHAAPVTVENLGFQNEQATKIRLKVTNHSNKDIRKILVTLYSPGDAVYWGANVSFDGRSDFDPLVVAGQSITQDQTLYEPPPGGTEFEPSVRQIIFTDGTTWRAKSRPSPFALPDPL